MENSNPKYTPIEKFNVDSNHGNKNEKFPYQEVIGSLLYSTVKTRIDITFAVNYASRFTSNPTSQDVANVKRTLAYLNAHPKCGIFYSADNTKSKEVHIVSYCDSDYAGNHTDSKSTTGYVLMYAGGPISWTSRKQSVVAQATAEAEYISGAHCCQELKYMKSFVEELLGVKPKITLYVDNQSAIAMIKSGQLSRKSKHIDVKYHFVNDELQKGWFNIKHVKSQENLADILTKPLCRRVFENLKTVLMHTP
ncbi:hypothetical protein ONE63_007921 [Megalurothrips usitatus]|uniref:Retrovirus-related Pol polyprotein from transposon TNT 1-94 n=1 Tax=Megalurothrips usitatus TaxID=439358 RepID=A0AAV7XVN5_9NEOP|nr:hypothetical protein ONE63_007921 [Megalurothrips usitatus]